MTGEAPPLPQETEEIVSVCESGEPYTSREIADELECARTTAYKKLQRLVEAKILNTKKVGARGRVWWLPLAVEPSGLNAGWETAEQQREHGDLVASEQQFRAVFEAAFDAILIVDDDAKYVDVNPAACALFGLPRDDLLGHTIADFAADGYDVETAWQDFQAAGLDRGLFPLVRADGEHRLVEFAATPNILPGRHLSVLRDVTERQDTKAQLEHERERHQQYQKTLAADTVIQLEIQVDDEVCNRFAAALDCTCEFEGLVATSDGQLLHYMTVSGAPPTAIRAMAAESAHIQQYRVVFATEEATLLEVALEQSPIKTLVEAGANGRSMQSSGEGTTVVAELGADGDLQQLITAFTAVYPDAAIVAKRTVNRPIVTTRQYRESLATTLTERQIEVFRAAYLAGYFEWPRHSQAEALASSMGIAVSTWLRHLRLAEGKVARWFFEELEA
ncbi:bacterio-opsin activator domain-containing protein [Haloarcula nitratireducens]|uniref:Helix-turn-helix domain-containing protein n=1 Tax=Haloarcula nitratireducens TaxID=2487749 RepID=A0AAW4PKN0_9EURY|nr:bacterio-opsin activator domain-containing protein [Halomicroarcula nitratireducens]MBX0298267.1 helix-turn-helix domain-containing protein [Halomicroarcula nitratireducens]